MKTNYVEQIDDFEAQLLKRCINHAERMNYVNQVLEANKKVIKDLQGLTAK